MPDGSFGRWLARALALCVVLVSCRARTEQEQPTAVSQPREGSASSAGRGRHPDPVAALATCSTAAERATREAPDQRAGIVLQGCAQLYVEPACRNAMLASGSLPPESRAAAIARACRDAYCPLLAAPRPALCSLDLETMTPSDLAQRWSELDRAILALDLGLEEAQVATAPSFVGLLSLSVVPQSQDAAVAPEPLVFVLRQEGSGLVLSIARPGGQVTPLPLPSAPGTADYAAAIASAQPLPSGPGAVIEVDQSVQYAEVIELMDALRNAGYEEILLSSGGAAP